MAELMSIQELAAYLKLDRQTLYNWLHQKRLSGIKVGGVWRFNRESIDEWLKQQTVPAKPTGNGPAQRTSGGRRDTPTEP